MRRPFHPLALRAIASRPLALRPLALRPLAPRLRRAGRAAAGVALLMALTLPAAAQQKMTWHTQDGSDNAALVFGVPESEEVMVFFLCKPGAEGVTVQSMIGSKGLERESAARLVLSGSGVKKTFAGKAIGHDENTHVDVEAPARMADVKALLKGSGLLTIEVKGARQQVALTGAKAALAQFETACKGER